ncbi:MAG: sulfatase-like hydrolase/transferase [Gemmataceae bacterium]
MKQFFSTFAVCLFICGQAYGDSTEKPNVILILSDDLGFTDYGFMGHMVVRTPNLDRMASQSLLYTRGYVMPVCSPSLACLLTGKLPHQHGITGNDLSKEAAALAKRGGKVGRSPLSQKLLSNSVILPKLLSDAGYLTFQTGKLWNVTAPEVGFTDGMTMKEGRHGGEGLEIGRKTMQPIFDFIEKSQTEKKPFFIWHAPMMPHQPHNAPKEFLAHYEGKGLSAKAKQYFAMIEWFDKTCGELDSYLEKKDLTKNTVIIYLADNGWDAEQGNRAKLSPYEMGIRTPMFVRWPGKVKPMRDDESLASIIDFVPTVLTVCGVKVPSELTGVNLLDRPAMTARKSVFVEAYTHNIADLSNPSKSLVAQVVISGWSKLIIPGPVGPDMAYTSGPKGLELYDLKSDPLEKRDLRLEKPGEFKRLQAIQNTQWRY